MGKYIEALKRFYEEIEPQAPENGTDKTDKRAFVGNVSSIPGHIENFSHDEDSPPFSEHEIAEHKIGQLKMHDDRVFLRRTLLGVYGKKRLDIVNRYFEEWRKGEDGEPVEHRKQNAGRYRANTWMREYL
jgi:hypothetical protein